MATKECHITAVEPGFNQNQNNLSVPFHCYDGFSGDLGKTPANGHERAQGWNMSFYETSDGLPVATLTESQSNPFSFYVAAAVDSVGYGADDDGSLPYTDDRSFIDVGGGFSAFALNCEATIHDVRYSLVNGSFQSFNASKASPQKASIIKAPLQVGFGQYHLYEFAKTAVGSTGASPNDTMSNGIQPDCHGASLWSLRFQLQYNCTISVDAHSYQGSQSSILVPGHHLSLVCRVWLSDDHRGIDFSEAKASDPRASGLPNETVGGAH